MIRLVYAYLPFPENDNFYNRLKNNSHSFFPWMSSFIPNHSLTSILFCHAYYINQMESELANMFKNCFCCQISLVIKFLFNVCWFWVIQAQQHLPHRRALRTRTAWLQPLAFYWRFAWILFVLIFLPLILFVFHPQCGPEKPKPAALAIKQNKTKITLTFLPSCCTSYPYRN